MNSSQRFTVGRLEAEELLTAAPLPGTEHDEGEALALLSAVVQVDTCLSELAKTGPPPGDRQRRRRLPARYCEDEGFNLVFRDRTYDLQVMKLARR